MVRVHKTVLNESAPHTLLSQFQMSECVNDVDAKSKKHRGKQRIQLDEKTHILLATRKCMMTLKHRCPTEKELEELDHHLNSSIVRHFGVGFLVLQYCICRVIACDYHYQQQLPG